MTTTTGLPHPTDMLYSSKAVTIVVGNCPFLRHWFDSVEIQTQDIRVNDFIYLDSQVKVFEALSVQSGKRNSRHIRSMTISDDRGSTVANHDFTSSVNLYLC